MEAEEEVVGNGHSVCAEGFGEGKCGREFYLAVEGILGGVDGFHADEQRVKRGGGGGHRDQPR